MQLKQIIIAAILIAATAAVGYLIAKSEILKSKLRVVASAPSQTFDPRTWHLSDEDISIINSLSAEQQKSVADKWKAAIKENPNQSGEGLYKLLIRTETL
jgi:hypothetical protein